MKLSKDNYVIGITGGVGAGKSTVLYVLENAYGASITQADRVSRSITLQGQPAYEAVIELFGKEILMPDGNPDRNKIAHIVFEDEDKLEKLDAIIHPHVYEFLKKKACNKKGLVVLEAALPKEAHFDELCDEIWYIYSDEETRINRCIETRGYTRQKAEEIIASQISDVEYRKIADVVIDNTGSLEEVERQVAERINHIQTVASNIINKQ